MLRVGTWVGSFRSARILLLPWQGENFSHRQHLKFATFKVHTVHAKTLYLQRYSTDFRNLCLSWKMLRVGIWVGSFRYPDILLLQWKGENFAHRQHLKFCHFSTCSLRQQKSYISKGILTILEIFGSARRCWAWAFGEKLQEGRYFTFPMPRGKLCASTIFEILPLSTCTLCQQKPKIFNRIQPIFEIFASARRCWGWAFGRKFQVRRYFTFAVERWKFCTSTTFEILPLSTGSLRQQKSYISKGIVTIFEIFCSARRCWAWVFGEKLQEGRYFTFAMRRWKLCASKIFEILPLSTCTLCQQKPKIFNRIQPIFEIFASARRC